MSFDKTADLIARAIAAMRAGGIHPDAAIFIIIRHDQTNTQLIGSTKTSQKEQIAFLERTLKRLRESMDYERLDLVDPLTGKHMKKGKA